MRNASHTQSHTDVEGSTHTLSLGVCCVLDKGSAAVTPHGLAHLRSSQIKYPECISHYAKKGQGGRPLAAKENDSFWLSRQQASVMANRPASKHWMQSGLPASKRYMQSGLPASKHRMQSGLHPQLETPGVAPGTQPSYSSLPHSPAVGALPLRELPLWRQSVIVRVKAT